MPYAGPIALNFSKYANPSLMKAVHAIPTEVTSASTSPARTAIATKEQIDASNNESAAHLSAQSADIELAIAQGNVLKDEVSKHVATFSMTVNQVAARTRDILKALREAAGAPSTLR